MMTMTITTMIMIIKLEKTYPGNQKVLLPFGGVKFKSKLNMNF